MMSCAKNFLLFGFNSINRDKRLAASLGSCSRKCNLANCFNKMVTFELFTYKETNSLQYIFRI